MTEPTLSQDVLETVPAWGATLAGYVHALEERVSTLEQDLEQAEIRAQDAQERVAILEALINDLEYRGQDLPRGEDD